MTVRPQSSTIIVPKTSFERKDTNRQATVIRASSGAAASRLRLTGILALAHVRLAFLKLERFDGQVEYYTLVEGQDLAGVELLAVDVRTVKATVRNNGRLFELSFTEQTREDEAARVIELQRDASHTAHHVRRAQLDRERDELERQEALASHPQLGSGQ